MYWSGWVPILRAVTVEICTPPVEDTCKFKLCTQGVLIIQVLFVIFIKISMLESQNAKGAFCHPNLPENKLISTFCQFWFCMDLLLQNEFPGFVINQ